jgi:hypothetical protein
VRTTNGFSTTTRDTAAGKVIGVFSDGVAIGNSLTTTELPASNTNQKGLYIDAVTEQVGFLGFVHDVNQTPNLYLWEGSTGPSGSPTRSGTRQSSVTSTGTGVFLSTVYNLQKATVYRIMANAAGSHQVPRRGVIGTGVDSNLMKCFMGQGGWYWGESNGTSDWSNDITTKFPLMSFYLEDSVAITASAGAGPLVGGGNLVG